MCLLGSPSSMRSAISEPLSCEAVEPGEVEGVESLTDPGECCGDAVSSAVFASCTSCCLDALMGGAILDFSCPLPQVPGKKVSSCLCRVLSVPECWDRFCRLWDIISAVLEPGSAGMLRGKLRCKRR